MKKHLFWLALGAIALSACATTDVIEEGAQSSAIGFQSVISKSQKSADTRAVTGDLTLKGFSHFWVYGYYTKEGKEANPVTVFPGDKVTKNVTEKMIEGETTEVVSWDYDHTRYWMPDATYYFYAYSCADDPLVDVNKGSIGFDVSAQDADAETRIDNRSLKINNYTCDATHQHDLVCAFKEGVTGKPSGNGAVQFIFKHALCKVSAEFVNDFPTGYTIEISDVKITNFYDKASYNVRSDAWSGQSRSAEDKALAMAINGVNSIDSTEDMESEEDEEPKVETASVFLLPVSYGTANVHLQFTLSIKQGKEEFLYRTIQGTWKPEWKSGMAYRYTVHISGSTTKLEPIVFEATQDITDVDNWNGNITSKMEFDVI